MKKTSSMNVLRQTETMVPLVKSSLNVEVSASQMHKLIKTVSFGMVVVSMV